MKKLDIFEYTIRENNKMEDEKQMNVRNIKTTIKRAGAYEKSSSSQGAKRWYKK